MSSSELSGDAVLRQIYDHSTGSIRTVSTPDGGGGETKSIYSGVTSVAMGIMTNVLTYVVPSGKSFYMNRAEVSGTNIAEYSVQFSSTVNAKKRTFYGNLNETFDYTMTSGNGLGISEGIIITITVIHHRPFVGDFDARIQGLEM